MMVIGTEHAFCGECVRVCVGQKIKINKKEKKKKKVSEEREKKK
jgi:hypothetical protein